MNIGTHIDDSAREKGKKIEKKRTEQRERDIDDYCFNIFSTKKMKLTITRVSITT